MWREVLKKTRYELVLGSKLAAQYDVPHPPAAVKLWMTK